MAETTPTPARPLGPAARGTISALELRKLAETADGHRGEPLALVWRSTASAGAGAAGTYKVVKKGEVDTGTDDVVCEINTGYENTSRGDRTLGEVTISGGDRGFPPNDVLKKYDALFWSEAAVEKFAFPYYCRQTPWKDFDTLQSIYLQSPDILALAHTPDSDPDSIASSGLHLLFASGPKSLNTFLLELRTQFGATGHR